MKERILHMLAQGLQGSQIASVIGCSASYVVQVAKDPICLERLGELRKEYAGKEDADGVILNNKYNALEHSLLKKIGDSLEDAELPVLTRTLEVIGNRQEKRLQRMTMASVGGAGSSLHVHLTLPSHATLNLPSYQLNENKEVIAIGGREMAPMSSEGVKNLFGQLASGRGLGGSSSQLVDHNRVLEASEVFKEVKEIREVREIEVDISGTEF